MYTNTYIYIYIYIYIILIHTFIHTNMSLKETKKTHAAKILQPNAVNWQINKFKVRKTTRNHNEFNCTSHEIVQWTNILHGPDSFGAFSLLFRVEFLLVRANSCQSDLNKLELTISSKALHPGKGQLHTPVASFSRMYRCPLDRGLGGPELARMLKLQ
jgi:hypothetical protein